MPRSYSSSNILANLPRDGTAIRLYTPPEQQFGQLMAKYDGTIESLTANIKLQSIPEVELPEFDLTADQSQRFNTIRDLQYTHPRFELRLFLSLDGGTTKHQLAALSLLNMQRSGYTMDLLQPMGAPVSYRVAFGASLWASVHNVGYGLPTTSDSVLIHGSVNEEAYTEPIELETLGLQRHTAITLLAMRTANLAQSIQSLIDTWDGRLEFVSHHHNVFHQNILPSPPPPPLGITSAIFDAIVVNRDGSVAISGGKVWINPILLPSEVPPELFEAIRVVNGEILTTGGNVQIDPTRVPAGFTVNFQELANKIVVDGSGKVVTYQGYVVYLP